MDDQVADRSLGYLRPGTHVVEVGMERMVFPIEEPDIETLVFDVLDVMGQAFGMPDLPDISLDVDAILAPLYVDTALAHAEYVRGE